MGLFSKKKEAKPIPCSQSTTRLQPSGRRHESTQHRPGPNPSPSPFQTPGFFPPPPPPPPPLPHGWNHSRPVRPVVPVRPVGTPAPVPVPCRGQDPRHYPPIIVNQHYYLNSPPNHPPPPHLNYSNLYPSSGGGYTSSRLKLGSTSSLVQLPAEVINQIVDDGLPRWHAYGTQLINQGAALCDQISSKFDDVMTQIDRGKLTGNEDELFMYQQPSQISVSQSVDHHSVVPKGGQGKKKSKDAPKGQTTAVAASFITGGYFAKVDLYANSRLPFDLPFFRV